MEVKQTATGYVSALAEDEEQVPTATSTAGATSVQDINDDPSNLVVADDVLMKAQKGQADLPGFADAAALLATTVQPMPTAADPAPTRPGAVSMRGCVAWREEEGAAPDNNNTVEEVAVDLRRLEAQDGESTVIGEAPAQMETTTEGTSNANQQSFNLVQMEQEIRERLVRDTATETSMGTVIATANLVEETYPEFNEAQLEQEIRERIIRESVEANVVITEEYNQEGKGRCGRLARLGLAGIFLIVIFVVAVVVAVVIINQSKNDGSELFNDSTTTSDEASDPSQIAEDSYWNFSTIERARDRGYVKCGTFDNLRGFGHRVVIGDGDGINIDQVRIHCIE